MQTIFASAATVAAPSIVPAAAAVPDPIFVAIERHRAAYDAHIAVSFHFLLFQQIGGALEATTNA
jgi:hypothetical protein